MFIDPLQYYRRFFVHQEMSYCTIDHLYIDSFAAIPNTMYTPASKGGVQYEDAVLPVKVSHVKDMTVSQKSYL